MSGNPKKNPQETPGPRLSAVSNNQVNEASTARRIAS
jgi:hypothetical protein